MKLSEMSKEQLNDFLSTTQKEYDEIKSKGLKLDMSRGKPSPSQLDMSLPMADVIGSDPKDYLTGNNTDVRNYGILDGIDEAKELFAPMLGVSKNEIFIGGSSSLTLMYDTLAKLMIFGASKEAVPYCKQEKIKFLCPVPGYDRHFLITEQLGIEMINIPMTSEGPDMDLVEQYVNNDPTVKGIWCVPMYANPTGITYSDETVKRFAALKPAAEDFRIFWDNAYCIHHLTDTPDKLLNILDECKKTGSEDMVFIFGSTSKITFAGAGVAAMGMSENNLKYFKSLITAQAIGYDKVNQLRHVKFFKNYEGLIEHMKKHTAQLAPKFKVVLDTLEREIAPLGIGSWYKPNGGYFVSFDAPAGCAKEIVSLCKDAGLVLTGAGATFPYGKDPDDSNIRIAPSYPSPEELQLAIDLFCVCVKLSAAKQLLK